MTTGRINQVSKINFPGANQEKLKLNELDSFKFCVHRSENLNAEAEFYFHHIIQAAADESTASTETSPKLLDHATSVLPLIANRCETWNSSKVKIQILKHFAIPKNCLLRTLVFPNSHPSPEKAGGLEC